MKYCVCFINHGLNHACYDSLFVSACGFSSAVEQALNIFENNQNIFCDIEIISIVKVVL